MIFALYTGKRFKQALELGERHYSDPAWRYGFLSTLGTRFSMHSSTSLQTDAHCPLCRADSGRVVWRSAFWRIVHADTGDDAHFPAFYRLICNAHYAEWTDLPEPRRQENMTILAHMETLMRTHLQPKKVNLASLGNAVPHVHWHVIGRFDWDSHFPNPVWGVPLRTVDACEMSALQARLPIFEKALQQTLGVL